MQSKLILTCCSQLVVVAMCWAQAHAALPQVIPKPAPIAAKQQQTKALTPFWEKEIKGKPSRSGPQATLSIKTAALGYFSGTGNPGELAKPAELQMASERINSYPLYQIRNTDTTTLSIRDCYHLDFTLEGFISDFGMVIPNRADANCD